jgi:hypothetical protein
LPAARRARHWSRPGGRGRPPRFRLAAMTTTTLCASAPGQSGGRPRN